mgnify:CR=1 FL=1
MTKYYSTQRPIGPGTYPKPQDNNIIEIKNLAHCIMKLHT